MEIRAGTGLIDRHRGRGGRQALPEADHVKPDFCNKIDQNPAFAAMVAAYWQPIEQLGTAGSRASSRLQNSSEEWCS